MRCCRGKFELLLCADRVALRNARTTLVLPLADLARVYILDGMGGDKAGKVVLLLQLQPGRHVVHGKQQLANFAMEVKADAQLDVPALRGVGDNVKVCTACPECAVCACNARRTAAQRRLAPTPCGVAVDERAR